MARRASLLLSFCIILTVSLHLSEAQHWSHGWYPGGKRQADSAQSLEVRGSALPPAPPFSNPLSSAHGIPIAGRATLDAAERWWQQYTGLQGPLISSSQAVLVSFGLCPFLTGSQHLSQGKTQLQCFF
uniref:Progonadoliberin n=1 Tax=Varanus komodoensis TaxID=61221 RepID=A0A8D2Q9C2_VARKO